MVEVIVRPTFQEMYERGRIAPHLFAQDFLGVECHIGQIAWLMRANWDEGAKHWLVKKPYAKEGALAASNRWGKTFINSVKLLHRAFYRIRPDDYRFDPVTGRIRDYKCVSVAMSLDQAMLSFNYAYGLATNSKMFRRFVVDQVGTPFPRMTIGVNHGKESEQWRADIWARSTAKRAKYLLGHNFNYISWDEAAFDAAIGTGVLDEVIRMRLVDQAGDLDLISSPNGYNMFQNIWSLGQDRTQPDFYSLSGDIWQNRSPKTGKPNIDFADIKKKMKRMHPDWVEQNVWGRFAKLMNIFPLESVMRCYEGQDYNVIPRSELMLPVKPNFVIVPKTVKGPGGEESEILVAVQSESRRRYVIGADLARKRDYTCIVVLQLPEQEGEPMRMVYFDMLQKVQWRDQFTKIKMLSDAFNGAKVVIDSTAQAGDMALEQLQNDYFDQAPERVEGYQFSETTKTNLILQLQEAIQSRSVVFPYMQTLVDQLIYYQWDDKKLQTDAVMGFGLAIEAAKRVLGLAMFEQIMAPDIPAYVIRSDPFGNRVALLNETDGPVRRVVLL
jgi:hypothetical protein